MTNFLDHDGNKISLSKYWEGSLSRPLATQVMTSTIQAYEQISRHENYAESHQRVLEMGVNRVYSWPRFVLEVFTVLFEFEPAWVQPSSENRWVHDLLQHLQVREDFRLSRQMCLAKPGTSMLAAIQFCGALYRHIEETTSEPLSQEAGKLAEELQERYQLELFCQQKLQEKLAALETERDRLKLERQLNPTKGLDKAIREKEDAIAKLKAKIQAQQAKLDELQKQVDISVAEAEKFCKELSQELTLEALDKILEEMAFELEKHRCIQLGESGAGAFGELGSSYAESTKRQLAKRIQSDPRLQKIIQVAGKLRAIAAQGQMGKSKLIPEEIHGYEAGDDLTRLAPTELARLHDPDLFPMLAKEYAEGKLTQLDMDGHHNVGQGPVVMCIDRSASMGGLPEVWASALALVLLETAVAQDREFRLVHFGGSVERIDKFNQHSSPLAILDAVAVGSSLYATDFYDPLKASIRLLEEDPDLKDGDIVFLTDGQSEMTDDFISDAYQPAKKRLKFSCYSFMIAPDLKGQLVSRGTIQEATESLAKFSDQLAIIDDFDSQLTSQELESLFSQI